MSRDSEPSTSKGKGRAVDSDEEQQQGEGTTSEHNSQQRSSPPQKKKKKAAAQEEGEEDHDGAEGAQVGAVVETEQQRQTRIRETRAGYRKLQTELEGDRNNLIDTTVERISARVMSANSLFRKVRGPAEAVLDSRVLLTASDAGALKARQLKLDANAFDTDEFIIKLTQFMGGLGGAGGRNGRRQVGDSDDDDDSDDGQRGMRWDLVGKVLAAESRRAPTIDFMFGPLESSAKQRVARKERQRAQVDESERTKPVELASGDIGKNPNETTKMVAQISAELEEFGEKGVPYLKFVTNPNSFAQTVENMFYFSFLVREGKCAIEEDDDQSSPWFGDFIAFRCEPPSEEDKKTSSTCQLVFELTHDVWEGAIEVYGLRGQKSLIKHREPVVVAAGTQRAQWT